MAGKQVRVEAEPILFLAVTMLVDWDLMGQVLLEEKLEEYA